MDGELTFRSVVEDDRGVLVAMLSECYAKIWNDKLGHFFGQFEKDVFDNPDTVGACVFISCLSGKEVGFGSFDPRKGPELGVIGHNCILPQFQGRGFGKAQIEKILNRFRLGKFAKATVCTGDTEFFEPARRMYEACGLHETKHSPEPTAHGWGMIYYEIEF